jgi:signal transduction histidine kinase
METAISIINIATTLSILVVGLLTFYRRDSKATLYFAYLSFTIAPWLFLQYLAQVLNHPTTSLWLIRASYVFSNTLVMFFVLFMQAYTSGRISSAQARLNKVLIGIAVIVSCFDLTSLSVQKVDASLSGISSQVGTFYTVKLLFLFICLLYGVALFIRRLFKSTNAERRRDYILGFAIVQAIVVAGVTTTIFASNAVSQLAIPLTLLIMVALIGFAILRHRLFDIRLIVARSVAYALTILGAIVLYGFIAFGVVARLFFRHQQFGVGQQVVFSVLTVILVFTFPTIQKFFNKATNQLFYRDAYDAQIFLNQFNKTLVSTYNLQELLQNGSSIIEKNLKSNFCVFIIEDDTTKIFRTIGANNRVIFNEKDFGRLSVVFKSQQRPLVTDELDEGQARIKDILQLNKIAIVARLATTSSATGVGYLVLGAKKSGSPYTSQDVNIVDIIANELTIAAQNALHFEEIQNFNLTLQAKVEEATRQLKRNNQRLRELDSTKDDFISMASHQLRTPLTSVKGYLSMVLEGDAGPLNDNQRKLLEQSYRSSQQMVYLISDLLNLSRLNTGKFIIENSVVSLNEVVQAEVEQLAETAKARGVTLVYDKPKSFPKLLLDETKTHQVIMNFIDNAIYYTPSGGTVTIALRETPTTVEYTVKDNGIGVPKSVQHKLFTKFYRAQNAQKARPDGTGLGLFMAKKVVVAQGGATIFESEEGKGSTFGFRFNKAGHVPPTE